MSASRRAPEVLLAVIAITLQVLLAALLLLFGVGNLISPDVDPSYLVQNTRVGVIVILAGLVSIYAIFRPYTGGFVMCICAVALGFIFCGSFPNPLAVAVLLLGVLSIIRGRLSRSTTPGDHDQAP
jgi:hypothetical protein